MVYNLHTMEVIGMVTTIHGEALRISAIRRSLHSQQSAGSTALAEIESMRAAHAAALAEKINSACSKFVAFSALACEDCNSDDVKKQFATDPVKINAWIERVKRAAKEHTVSTTNK
jgi:hypothetical protein